MKRKLIITLTILLAATVTVGVLFIYWKSSKDERKQLEDNFVEYYDNSKNSHYEDTVNDEDTEKVELGDMESTEVSQVDYKQMDVIALTSDILKDTPYCNLQISWMDENYLDNGDRVCNMRVGCSTFLYTITIHPDSTYDVLFTPSTFNPGSPGVYYYVQPSSLDETLQIDKLASTLGTKNILWVRTCWGNYAELEDIVDGTYYVVNFSSNTIEKGHRPEGE